MGKPDDEIREEIESFFRALKSAIALVEKNKKLFGPGTLKMVRTGFPQIAEKVSDGSIELNENVCKNARKLMILVSHTVIGKVRAGINQELGDLKEMACEKQENLDPRKVRAIEVLVDRIVKVLNAPNN